MTHTQIGARGEALAAEYLEAKGWRIMERNYRFERAEVDLVCFEPAAEAANGGEIVFVEVKTRTGVGFGRPEEAVTEAKQAHIVHASRAFLYEYQLEGAPCRFDVVSVVLHGAAPPEITHFRDAFVAS
ncbi:MAG: YraN family protein [Bacteroidetes bacterium]|jgi:putative endonuclease|nr:YraN family protein [Bacteroidota bacterium]